MSIAVILPTYNEKENIIRLVTKIVVSIRKITSQYTICIVDDNSSDNTGKICKSRFKNNKNVKVFIRMHEKGFASAILFGILKTKEDIIVVMDTDFSHDPKLLPAIVSKLDVNDIVIASRYAKNGGGENRTRFLLSKIYNLYLRYLLKIKISDFLFGYFCIKRKFMIKNKLLQKKIFYGFGDYFIRLAYYIYKADGKFFEIPAYYKDRIYGISKSNIVKMFFSYTITSWKVYLLRFNGN